MRIRTIRTGCDARLLPLLTLLLLTLPAVVQAQFTFVTNNGALTIEGYTGPGGAVIVPATTNELPVTSIGDSAFYINGYTVTSVTIPNSVTNIGLRAFRYCSSLTNVMLTDGLLTIDAGAFAGCYALARITIPNTVIAVGTYAFDSTALTNIVIPGSLTNIGRAAFDSTGLKNFTVDPANSSYSSADGVLFDKNQVTLIRCPVGKLGSYAIPGGVTCIGDGAFYSCAQLFTITIPNSVTNIGEEAFAVCCILTSAIIPDGVTKISYSAFSYCTNLISVTIPNGVTSIGAGAFSRCSSLASATIPDSVTNIGNFAFQLCFKLASVTIPTSVTSIGQEAFYYCRSLTNVIIPVSVTSLGSRAFQYCTSLTSVIIPDGVTNVGTYSFANCSNLNTVIIRDSVISIGDHALSDCINLAGVYFQGDAPGTGSAVFYGDSNATVYYLPGKSGWGATFAGRPTAQWQLPSPLILNNGSSFGLQTNRFGFIISWASNVPVAVEVCTNPGNAVWSALETNSLTDGWSYFSDPQWTNYPARFYRLRWP